jgi:hypothetical protein
MKTLEEKKMLVKMARMLGQPVDQALIESIEREEKLAAAFFNESKKELVEDKILILKEDLLTEADPVPDPKPAETNLQPPEEYKVQQVANYLDTVSNTKKPPLATALMDKEFEALRKTVMDLLQKVNTLSWGGGGTGIVRIWNADDLDRNSAQNGRFVKYQNGWFVFDDISGGGPQGPQGPQGPSGPSVTGPQGPQGPQGPAGTGLVNTVLITSSTYTVDANDYYIGVNYAGNVTITVPASTNGRMIVIKDESGNCSNNPIIALGTIDNDANGFNLQIDNGAVHMLYRSGWRIV